MKFPFSAKRVKEPALGLQGEQGPAGPTGTQGPQGDTGATGPQGNTGASGGFLVVDADGREIGHYAGTEWSPEDGAMFALIADSLVTMTVSETRPDVSFLVTRSTEVLFEELGCQGTAYVYQNQHPFPHVMVVTDQGGGISSSSTPRMFAVGMETGETHTIQSRLEKSSGTGRCWSSGGTLDGLRSAVEVTPELPFKAPVYIVSEE